MSSLTLEDPSTETTNYQEAFAMVEELDQIRSVYGNDCLTFVKKALVVSHDPDWKGVVSGAIWSWQRTHPRVDLDDISR